MFVGESTHTLDAKHRLAVPKRLQEGLDRNEEGQLLAIVTRGFEGCLFLFSESGFQELARRVRTGAFEGKELRNIQRMFFSSSFQVQLDASGRILLPEKLREFAAIEREVAMIGVVDRVEIWAKDKWNAFESENSSHYDQLDKVLLGAETPEGEG